MTGCGFLAAVAWYSFNLTTMSPQRFFAPHPVPAHGLFRMRLILWSGVVVFGSMSLLSAWLIAWWRRHRLEIDSDGVLNQGVFFRRVVRWDQVSEMRRRGYAVSLRLRKGRRMSVSLLSYRRAHRQAILRMLHARGHHRERANPA